jgi:hypothetical protein
VRTGDVDEAVRLTGEHIQVPQRILEREPTAMTHPQIAASSGR